MVLIPTTFLRSPDFSKEMLRGVANAQMGILLNQMRLGNLNCAKRKIEFASGVQILCTVNYRDQHFDIYVPPDLGGENIREESVVGFMCHPGVAHAYDQVQDGARNGNRVVYWDKDKWKTQLKVVKVTTTDLLGNIISVDYVGDEYGNIDWKGPKQDPEIDPDQLYRKILTWKGPPSRYFPLGNQAAIEGVTVADHIIEGLIDTIYTTPFSAQVYEHGRTIATMPNLYWPLGLNSNHGAQVLGAAYRAADGKLIVVVKTCYNAYPREKAVAEMVSTWQVRHNGLFYQEWLEDQASADAQVLELGLGYETVEVPDPGRAYWFEVLVREPGPSLAGWNRILQVSTSATMPDTNWFFSEDATKIVAVMHGALHKVVITLTDGVSSASHTTETLGEITEAVTATSTTTTTNDYEDIAEHFPSTGVWEGGYVRQDFLAHTPGTGEYDSYVVPFVPPVNWLKNVYDVGDTITRSGTEIIAADYKENELVYAKKVVSGTESSSRHHVVLREIRGAVKWAHWYDPADHIPTLGFNLTIANSSSVGVGDRFQANPGQMCHPTITYTISEGAIDGDGYITALPCYTCTVTITVTAEATSEEGTVEASYPYTLLPLATFGWAATGWCPDPVGKELNTWYTESGDLWADNQCETKRWRVVSSAANTTQNIPECSVNLCYGYSSSTGQIVYRAYVSLAGGYNAIQASSLDAVDCGQYGGGAGFPWPSHEPLEYQGALWIAKWYDGDYGHPMTPHFEYNSYGQLIYVLATGVVYEVRQCAAVVNVLDYTMELQEAACA